MFTIHARWTNGAETGEKDSAVQHAAAGICIGVLAAKLKSGLQINLKPGFLSVWGAVKYRSAYFVIGCRLCLTVVRAVFDW